MRQLLPPNRVKFWDAREADAWRPKRYHATDWKLAEAALTAELRSIDLSA